MSTVMVDGLPIDYSGLPESARDSMRLYIEHGIMPGSFLSAVLENDLMGAVSRADMFNIKLLKEYCQWLYCYAPRDSFGSKENVKAWVSDK